MASLRIDVSEEMTELPEAVTRPLLRAEAITVLTGAGISAESGLPTFREKLTGLWSRFSPSELANPEAFDRNPDLVWGWYDWRRRQMAAALPNAAHDALTRLQQSAENFTLVTQNVDDLHERAGTVGAIHLHGQLNRSRCSKCGKPAGTAILGPSRAENDPPGLVSPPSCQYCNSPLRPDVTWFGEELPQNAFEEAMRAAQACDVFLCIGTSSLVFPAADLPIIAKRAGALLYVINVSSTRVDKQADFVLRGPAATVLPLLLKNRTDLSIKR